MASDGYTCPVCGWPHLDEPHRLPEGDPSFEVCVSCGTEFGNDEFGTTHEALRKRWLEERGGAWWSSRRNPPDGWDAMKQLEAAGLS